MGWGEALATCLIVSGILETHAAVRMFTAAVPDTIVTICRLRATPETLQARIRLRGRGCGPHLPGDQDLSGAATARLLALLQESLEAAALLERKGIGTLCVDTTGRSINEIAQLILAKADGWSSLLENPQD